MDALGDRMKAYEAVETERRFQPLWLMPIYARIDGRGFSKFTKGMDRPFDADMMSIMIETTRFLVEETGASVGYTQSDEISLAWHSADPKAEAPFGGKPQKMVSLLAGLATAAFTREILASHRLRPYAARLPHFDARAFQLPSLWEAANCFIFREMDARKNAVSMAAQSISSHRALMGRTTSERRQMLAAAGIDFAAYPEGFRKGTYLQRVVRERQLTPDELSRIPEAHRPPADQLFTRSAVEVRQLPEADRIANLPEVLFGGAAPLLKPSEQSGRD